MKQHPQQYYLKQCRKCLLEIQRLSTEDSVAFLRLKKRAAKYLEKAKALEAASSKNQLSEVPSGSLS